MKRIFIDTDCGVDDAVAIMIALASRELKVVGVSAVSGNVGLERVMDNVLRLLSFLRREEIPLFRGASRPLVAETRHAENVHGKNGLGEVELPLTQKREEASRAPAGLYRIARENPGLTVVALGPLTNLAMAFNLYPELEDLVGEVVVMGGAITSGNVTRFAEFNFYADPESVQFLLERNIPLTVVPWDGIVQVPYSEEEIQEMSFQGSAAGRLLLDLLRLPLAFGERYYGRRVTALPDPLTVAYVVNPGVARRIMPGHLRMELNDTTLRGASITVPGERLKLVMEFDKDRFTDILLRIKELVA